MTMLRWFIPAAALCLAAAAAPADPSAKALQSALDKAADRSGLEVGFAIRDLVRGQEFLRQPDVVFPQGSSIRIHLIAELFRQAAAGRLDLDEPRAVPEGARTGGTGVLRYLGAGSVRMSLRDYAALVVTVNDNIAANLITDVVGMERVNAALEAQGTPEIRFLRRAVSRRVQPDAPDNEATPRATLRALQLLHEGKVGGRETSDRIVEILSLPEVSYFRRDLPAAVRFAGRSGSGPRFRCDAGIVLVPERPYVLTVMVKGLDASNPRRGHPEADVLIGQLSRLAYEYFSGAKAAPAKR